MVDQRSEKAAVLAIISRTEMLWYEAGALIETVGSACALLEGAWDDLEPDDIESARKLAYAVTPDDLKAQARLIDELHGEGAECLTVLDAGYPANLRDIHNRPPFLFVRGKLLPEDRRAIAVVGTRQAQPEGVVLARRFARELADAGTTVLSGMALGIDTAAHEAAIEAGGRTIAVFGTGIRRIYPKQNRDLARRMVDSGAVVSQFWPDAPPTRVSFPMRNVVTSGMAIGTVVVEAHGHSGARNQARQCLEHGKLLFLVRELVMKEEWARKYADRPGVTVIESTDDVLAVMERVMEAPQQLTMC